MHQSNIERLSGRYFLLLKHAECFSDLLIRAVITHYTEMLFYDSQTAAASLHPDQFAGIKNLFISLLCY